jgi:hypothetical protein
LNDTTPPSSRPSNSGMATCIATSIGLRPLSLASHAARERVTQTAWITGTSSAASASARQPPAVSSAAVEPPDASTVTISASTVPASRSSAGTRPSAPGRSDCVHTHTGSAPPSATARASTSTNAVFPAARCER